MALGLPLEVCLRLYDGIMLLSGIVLEILMKHWLKAYYFISEYIYWLLCIGEKLACLRTVAKKSALTQN